MHGERMLASERRSQGTTHNDTLVAYQPWFYAAALYNLLWGAANILWPRAILRRLGMPDARELPFWQVVGMFVLVYAPAYWWAGRHPSRHPQFILIGLIGKILGPIGFVWSAGRGDLPLTFGWTILFNDLIWWPAFGAYLRAAAARRGGWLAIILGE